MNEALGSGKNLTFIDKPFKFFIINMKSKLLLIHISSRQYDLKAANDLYMIYKYIEMKNEDYKL